MKKLTLREFAQYCEKYAGVPATDTNTTHIRRYDGMCFIYSSEETSIKQRGNAFSPLPYTGFSYTGYYSTVIMSLCFPSSLYFCNSDSYIRFDNVEQITIAPEFTGDIPSIPGDTARFVNATLLTADVIHIISKDDRETRHTVFLVRAANEN